MHGTGVSITANETRDAALSSTTGVSRYINISTLRSNAAHTRLPILQSRLPPTPTASSRGHALQQNDTRDSIAIMSNSYRTNDTMQKYVHQLLQEMNVDDDLKTAITSMPRPPLRDDEELGEAPLGDPAAEAIGLFHCRHIGLLISVVVASLMAPLLKRGVLPIMRSELQMAEYQADAAEVLLMLPWSTMFAIGFLSDCFAMFGTHRKSYVVLGWALVSVTLFVLSILAYMHSQDTARGRTSPAFVNGAIFLLGVACFGQILTLVMAEIYLVAMSKRERLRDRGEVVGTVLLVQFFFESIGQALTSFVVFEPTNVGVRTMFKLRTILFFAALCSLVPLLSTIAFFDEDTELMTTGAPESQEQPPVNVVDKFKKHWKLVWTTLQRQSTWNVVRFLAVFGFFSEFLVKYAHLVLDKVCGVNVITVSTGKIIQELLMFAGVFVWRFFFLNVDWKWLTVFSYVLVAWFPPLFYSLLVLFNSSRDVGLYMLTGACRSFARGLVIALQVAMTVEIAPRGGEGVAVGITVSIGSVMRLVATTLSNALSYAFDTQTIAAQGLNIKLSLQDEITVERDPTAIKLPHALEQRVLFALLVCYGIKFIACASVGFLPHQKQHLQWLHRFGTSSPRNAAWTIVLLAVSLIVAAVFNAFVVTPQTSCLKAFGGKGCTKVV